MDQPFLSFFSNASRFILKLRGGSTEAALTRKAGSALAINSLGTLLAFTLQIILARALGVVEFGQYAYATTWLSVLTVLCRCGLDTATLRLLPEYMAKEQFALIRGYFRWSGIIAAVASIALSLLLTLVLFTQTEIEDSLRRVLFLSVLALPLSVYLAVQGSRFQAFHYIAWAQLPQVVLRPLIIAALVVCTAFASGKNLFAQSVMIAQIVSILTCMLIFAVGTRLVFPPQLLHGVRSYDRSAWVHVAAPMALVTGFDMLLNQTDVLIVGSLLSTTEAGVYAIATKITLLMPMAIIFVNTVAAPTIARLHAEGKTAQLQRMLTRIAWGSAAVSVPLCVGAIVFSRWLLGIFGSQFETGQSALVILAGGRLLVAFTGSVGYLMSMSNHQSEAAAILGATAFTNILLCSLLVPIWGIEGAALSTTVSMALWSIIMAAVAYRRTGINATILPAGIFCRQQIE